MRDGKYVILCIDDDPDFLDTLKPVIESADYLMVTADGAEEGLRVYQEERPDLVLVDLMMEEIDAGENFVKDVRLLGNSPPIIMLSSVGNSLALNTSYSDLGLDGLLQKPIDPKTLLATLKAELARTKGKRN